MNLWWNWQKYGQFLKLTDRAFFVKIEKLIVKNNHFNTKLWTTLRSPRNARLNQGTCYSQGKVSSFQGMCLLSYLNGWCGSYLRTTKECRTRYLKSSRLYILGYRQKIKKNTPRHFSAWDWPKKRFGGIFSAAGYRLRLPPGPFSPFRKKWDKTTIAQ